jgi:mRNA interferase MazF
MNRFDIVLVPFPFDDLSGTKLRPALCLTDQISVYNHIVIAFITSQVLKATESSDVLVEKSLADFSVSGLKVDSAIRLHRLVTVPTWLITRKLGLLPSSLTVSVEQELRILFAL